MSELAVCCFCLTAVADAPGLVGMDASPVDGTVNTSLGLGLGTSSGLPSGCLGLSVLGGVIGRILGGVPSFCGAVGLASRLLTGSVSCVLVSNMEISEFVGAIEVESSRSDELVEAEWAPLLTLVRRERRAGVWTVTGPRGRWAAAAAAAAGRGWPVIARGAGEADLLAAKVAAMKDADLGSGVGLPAADGDRYGLDAAEGEEAAA